MWYRLLYLLYSLNLHFLSIDATNDKDCLCRYVNDSKLFPNAKMKKILINNKPKLCLFALEDIEKGKEIRYFYGVALPWHIDEVRFSNNIFLLLNFT